jgi:hypothetical protein
VKFDQKWSNLPVFSWLAAAAFFVNDGDFVMEDVFFVIFRS